MREFRHTAGFMRPMGGPAAVGVALLVTSCFLAMCVRPQLVSRTAHLAGSSKLHDTDGTQSPPPTASSVSFVVEESSDTLYALARLAADQGIQIREAQYALTPGSEQHFAVTEMRFPVRTNYRDVRSFIDQILRTMPSVAIKRVRIQQVADRTSTSAPMAGPSLPNSERVSLGFVEVDITLLIFHRGSDGDRGNAMLPSEGSTRESIGAGIHR